MRPRLDRLHRAHSAASRAEMLEILGPAPDLGVADVRRLISRLRSFGEAGEPLRIGVVRSYTTELLRPYWEFESLLHGFALELYEAPYGLSLQETGESSGLLRHTPDVTFFFWRWEELEPRLAGPLSALTEEERKGVRQAALERLCLVLGAFRERLPGTMVLTFLPSLFPPELGEYDAMSSDSEASFWAAIKEQIASTLRSSFPSVSFCDLDLLTDELGRRGLFDPRLWYAARFPFSAAGSRALVRTLFGYTILFKRPPIKCLVLDADNTLWGGVIGEDGVSGIALGPDYPGSVYAAFQRRLLAYQQRGFLLALCSKNNPEDVREVLQTHPHQLLRERHFSAFRVNWRPKDENLVEIARELNIGLNALLVVDDSPHECLLLRQKVPELLVLQVPEEIPEIPFCLERVAQLQRTSLTPEDRARPRLYAEDEARRRQMAASRTIEEYLTSLHMVMRIGVDDEDVAERIAQLTQRTNQFNLTTRRYTAAKIQCFMRDPDWLVAHFSLADVFGDNGLVGVALLRGLATGDAEFDSFLMSCRVIGRRAEAAFLDRLLEILARAGVERVRARYFPTRKNELVRDFWPHEGFQPVGDAYELDLSETGRRRSGSSEIRVEEASLEGGRS